MENQDKSIKVIWPFIKIGTSAIKIEEINGIMYEKWNDVAGVRLSIGFANDKFYFWTEHYDPEIFDIAEIVAEAIREHDELTAKNNLNAQNLN